MRALLLCGVGALLLIAAPAASAATRYATPTGAGAACSESAPCSIRVAIENASDNDTVRLAVGEYALDTQQLQVTADNLTIEGPDTIGDSTTHVAFVLFGADHASGTRLGLFGATPTLRNLAISGEGSVALVGTSGGISGATLDRVFLANTSNTAGATAFEADASTVTNSIIRYDGSSAFGKALDLTGTLTGTLAYSANGIALAVRNAYHRTPHCSLTVRNTLAWGGGRNLRSDTTSGVVTACQAFTIDYDYSWIPNPAAPSPTLGGGLEISESAGRPITVTAGTSNLPNAAAVFDPSNPADSFLSTYMLAPTSPAVNAGCTAGCSTHDYYGRPRPIGTANDIGPTEATLLPSVSTPGSASVTRNSATLTATVNPNYGATTYSFAYRVAGAATWTDLASRSLAAVTTASGVTENLTALAAATTYEVRVVAVNAAGTATSATASFSTSAAQGTGVSKLTVGTIAQPQLRRAAVVFRVRVTTPKAGQVAVAVRTGKGKARRVHCRTRMAFAKASTATLRCVAGSATRAMLRRRAVVFAVATTFRPAAGATETVTRALRVPRRR